MVAHAVVTAGDRGRVTVPVTNTGERAGKAVAQLYVRPPAGAVARPRQELRAFATARLDPGARTEVDLELDARSFARWSDPDRSLDHEQSRLATSVPWVRAPSAAAPRGWYVDPGRYELHVGRSSADIMHVAAVEVREAVR